MKQFINPEVTVVISVHNGGSALAETLSSTLEQQDCNFECIVIDDGCTDGSGDLLDAWAARDQRLRIIHQANQGLTRALIKACSEARGEFIARQDVGDVSLPGRLAAQAKLLREQAGVAFVSCLHTLVGPGNEPLQEPASGRPSGEAGLHNRDGRIVAFPHHGTVMFRKSAYEMAGGYRPQFYFAQDVDLWTRLIECGDLAYVPQPLYQVRFELGSITARHRPSQQMLRALAVQASALRASGASDAQVLVRAAQIRPARQSGAQLQPRAGRAAAAYFVGSCLVQRGDPRARTYLLQAVRHAPLNVKGWYKLLQSYWARPGAQS